MASGERETSVCTGLCVLMSVGRVRFSVPLLYVKHIFKTCSKPDGSASTNQRLSH